MRKGLVGGSSPPPPKKKTLDILMLGCGFGVGGGFAFGVVLSSAFPFRLGVWSLSGLVLASLLVSCLPVPLIFVCFALAVGVCFGSGLSAGVSFGFSFLFLLVWGVWYRSWSCAELSSELRGPTMVVLIPNFFDHPLHSLAAPYCYDVVPMAHCSHRIFFAME